jgi:glycosyltransferase involved in cell wall biosynthesis
MNILNVYRTYYPDPPGGLQEAIRQICLSTNKCSVDNTIFTLSSNPGPAEIARPEARVVREKSWAAPASCDIGSMAAFSTFNRLKRESDLVHFYYPWPFMDLLQLNSKSEKPTILTYISDIVRQKALGRLYEPLMWKTLKDMDVIVANCQAYVDTSPILSHRDIRSKVRIIPLGIDEYSYPIEGENTILKRVGIGDEEPYFLFIGVLRYYKGLHTLIQAAKYVDAKIVIAGSGPEENALKKLCLDFQLKNVVFTGRVTNAEKVALLKKCLSFVLPSHLRSEAYGMVLVEASMMSKPMISCEIGTWTSFINVHSETGFVIPAEDFKELAISMNTLLSDSYLVEQMGKAARSRYEKIFSGHAVGEAYTSVYQELL